ncbi:transporter substrate-binding domain-containing protein [Variovorax boronicumulans]|uniref:transporter substrate-binding domain-containing protein n=1 Tax=Variovorax boronicumulans TaxID=436515 RepID=UPI0009F72287|nr:transporter substrate-binding domain-containing protein [Variovorax boronicumulans]
MTFKPTLHAALTRSFLAMAGLALCASVAAQTASPLDGTLKKIKDTGAITVATRGASIPFNYLDDHNKQAGFAWEISQRVVTQVKKDLQLARLEVKTLEVTPQTRIPLVANQTVDLECSSTTNNAERQNQVAFSTTFFVVGARLLVRKNSGIKHWADLVGKNVVVSAGTTAERMLRQLNEKNKWGIQIILAKDINENFLTVETGRAVAATQDDIILFSNIARARNPADWEVVGVPQQKEAYGCMLRKGDAAFKKLVDGVITGMMRSGEFTALYEKYFLKPIAVKGSVTVNFPMSPDMQELVRHPSDQPL